ncbi:MAG: hypothetical protein V4654_06240 [Bdellovibrionota bacterium]
MIQIKKLLPLFTATITALSINVVANAAPSEQTTQVITRTAASGQQATTRLSKNLFKQQQVQVPYEVQVPYQETETYIEQVPYQVQVPYTEYVTDYRDEYRCENVTRYRNEQRCESVTDYRQHCQAEQKCHTIPGEPGGCRDVTECDIGPGGGRVCETRRVCDGQGQPQQRCETVQRCENVPYTRNECRNVSVPYTDRECDNVSVPYQREVTGYRNETRYRSETRTRTVTKYREETRCCKTETQTVFDRQLQFQVLVSFPHDAVLQANESETLRVTLTSAQPGSVSVQTVNSLYGYKIISQSQSGEVINVQLGLTPLFDASNAGSSSLKGLQLVYSPLLGKFVVSFADSIAHSKVQTTSEIEVRDLATDALVEQGVAASLANGKTGLVVQATIPSHTKLRAVVKTTRVGSVIAQGLISFTSTAVYDRRILTDEDISILSDSSLVQLTAPNQQGLNAYIKLSDSSEQFSEVSTKYVLSLFEIKNGKLRAINSPQTVTREQAQASNGEVTLAKLLGNKASSILKAGSQIRVQVNVKRSVSSSNLNDPTPFAVTTDLVIQ